MASTTYLCICIYCMLQLGFLLKTTIVRNRTYTLSEHYFTVMLCMTLLSFVADMLSTLNHLNDIIYPFAMAGNYIELIVNTLLLPIYFLYVCRQISNLNTKLQNQIFYLITSLAFLCIGFVLSTYWTKKVFYFNYERDYHRGPWFWIPMLILFLMMIIIEVFIITQRNKIEASYFQSLVIFQLFPIVGWGLQSFVYGLPFSLISITFAALVIFINVQNRGMDTDYLTGVFNRKSLDAHLQYKMAVATNDKSFSALLIDIDHFKKINDAFGHNEGDLALIHATEIIRSAVRYKDFVARYGGDEFCIIIDDEDMVYLKKVRQNIKNAVDEFNRKKKKPYEISFSIGYAVYDAKKHMNREAFFEEVDINMYEEKNARN